VDNCSASWAWDQNDGMLRGRHATSPHCSASVISTCGRPSTSSGRIASYRRSALSSRGRGVACRLHRGSHRRPADL